MAANGPITEAMRDWLFQLADELIERLPEEQARELRKLARMVQRDIKQNAKVIANWERRRRT
jgi:predicted transcriptional regulator